MAIMANRGNSWTKSKDIPSVVILSFAQTITSYFRKDSNSQRRFACCEMRQTVKNRHQVLQCHQLLTAPPKGKAMAENQC